jgi:hypothetical protein
MINVKHMEEECGVKKKDVPKVQGKDMINVQYMVVEKDAENYIALK